MARPMPTALAQFLPPSPDTGVGGSRAFSGGADDRAPVSVYLHAITLEGDSHTRERQEDPAMRRHSCRPRDPHPTQAPPTAPTLLTLLAVIATLTGAAAPAAAQGVLRPLLTAHASLQPPTTCRFMSDVETFVSTTGFTQQVAIGCN